APVPAQAGPLPLHLPRPEDDEKALAAGARVTYRGQAREAEERVGEAAKRVWCQRFFPGRHGSQYIEVRQPEDEREQRALGPAPRPSGEHARRRRAPGPVDDPAGRGGRSG
ncbi:hypothetical protein H2201_009163, partial [Coniosporium apollinis]